jgi:hypothetical protein
MTHIRDLSTLCFLPYSRGPILAMGCASKARQLGCASFSLAPHMPWVVCPVPEEVLPKWTLAQVVVAILLSNFAAAS